MDAYMYVCTYVCMFVCLYEYMLESADEVHTSIS